VTFINVLHDYAFMYIIRGMDKNISTLLREVKSATGWSEPQIAKAIGASQPTVNRILHGQSDCMGKTHRAIEALHRTHCPVTEPIKAVA
jgi:transcriptional regulator with XRE-family HTH domain